MPLENEIQTDTIPELNEQWPLGVDIYSQGDNHIRLIKKVLKATFPNFTKPITLSSDEINRGSIPVGSIMLFYQAAAPVGWVRVMGVGNTYGVRIVQSTAEGGTGGGVDNPFFMDKVPNHVHKINIDTSEEQGEHVHKIDFYSASQNANHTHNIDGITNIDTHSHHLDLTTRATSIVNNQGNIPSGGPGGNAAVSGPNDFHTHSIEGWVDHDTHSHVIDIVSATENNAHAHKIQGDTGKNGGQHGHRVNGTTANPTVAVNWQPRYLSFILCVRS